MRYERVSTMESSFSLLGQVAARELFANPKVAEGMTEFSTYLDPNKFKELMTAPQ